MHSLVYMTQTKVVTWITKNLPLLLPVVAVLVVDHHLRLVAQTSLLMISLTGSDLSSHQEEQEASLVSANRSELWMTITVDHLISMSSPKL